MVSQIAPIPHHASAYSGEPLATGCHRHLTSCYGRTHPALHHVAIHITRLHPGMGSSPEGFCFASSPNSNAHRPSRPWGRVSRRTWPNIARSRQLQCLSPYYITGRPTSAMPADLRTIGCCCPHQVGDGALRRDPLPRGQRQPVCTQPCSRAKTSPFMCRRMRHVPA